MSRIVQLTMSIFVIFGSALLRVCDNLLKSDPIIPFCPLDLGSEEGDVILGELLGNGSYGQVRRILAPRHGMSFAAKSFERCPKLRSGENCHEAVRREFWFSSTFKHPNSVESLCLMRIDGVDHQLMELAPYGLMDLILFGSPTKREIWQLFKEICDVVEAMHRGGFAFRDLKLENFVLDRGGKVKIVDFGAAEFFHLPGDTALYSSQGLHGTLPYIAPEVLNGHPYDPRPADVWALGILYVTMSLKVLPWNGAALRDISYRLFSENDDYFVKTRAYPSVDSLPALPVGHDRGPSSLLSLLPCHSRSLIGRMLLLDPYQRPTMSDILVDEEIRNTDQVGLEIAEKMDSIEFAHSEERKSFPKWLDAGYVLLL